LALALFITAKNQSFIRGIQVESDDIPELFLKAGSVESLKVFKM
jgi:hypothetical protein